MTCLLSFDVEKEVRVKESGQLGIIRILIGIPYRVAWVSLIPGAIEHFDYMRMRTENGIESETVNMFEVTDLEVVPDGTIRRERLRELKEWGG